MNSKLYTHLGMAGALLIPALAVAAVDIPHMFKGGDRVSASEMNQNFEAMAEAIEALEAKVEALESTGLQPPARLGEHTKPTRVIYQARTDGVIVSRAENKGYDSTSIRLDIGTTEESVENC